MICKDRGIPPVLFFINFEGVMKASFHEKLVVLVIAAMMAGLFIKTIFF